MEKCKGTYFYFFIGVVVCVLSFSSSGQTQMSDIDRLVEAGILEKPEAYSYPAEGRHDPFKPFISERTLPSEDKDEIIDDTGKQLSGMQLFEPGQLSLVGILSSPSHNIALVEDQAKKGYILNIGTLIGKRGIVTDIESDRLIIEETAKTRIGRVIKSTIVMKLNKNN